jgi:hypothetical protein
MAAELPVPLVVTLLRMLDELWLPPIDLLRTDNVCFPMASLKVFQPNRLH